MDAIDQIVDRLSIFKNLYDIIRIVDPVSKKAIACEENTSCKIVETCFKFWEKESFCKNCVSMRAYREKDTSIKLEYKDDKVYITIASPVTIDDKLYIVEMLKDITTGSSILNNGLHVHNVEKFVMEMNNKIVIDELLGVYNRRHLMERLPADMNESISNNQPISIIALDVDLFSYVNQAYGFKSGDKILKELVQIVTRYTEGEKNWIARFGGDKLMIVLNKYNLQASYILAENLRQAIENIGFVCDSTLVKITVSLSVCELTGAKIDCDKLFQIIKDSMYEVKSQGRNRTIIKKL